MKYFFTTPIFYPNDKPHLGTAYTLIIADFFKRYYSLHHNSVILTTGTDEHGKKIYDTAINKNITPQEHVDGQRKNFLILKEQLNLQWDYFVYTSNPDHIKRAQDIWMKIFDKGLIYKGFYKGWYSQKDEQYFKLSELLDGKAPTGHEVQLIQEECYFFKLKSFKDKIIDHYENNKYTIEPQWRIKELINNLIHNDIEDLCISRQKSKLPWGISVPNDDNHVMYVWFDALTNYITILKYGSQDFLMDYWQNSYHIIGKDILYFHGIIWPAILMALDLPWFQQLIVHGWLTINNEKMSKSLGNVVNPCTLCQQLRPDYLKYFLLREIPLSSDYNFSKDLIIQRINEELADKIGNLVNRVVTMIIKYNHGIIPNGSDNINDFIEYDGILMENLVDERNINGYIQNILSMAGQLNKYIENSSPWKKDIDINHRNQILYNGSLGIYKLAQLLYPVTPEFSQNILITLNCNNFFESIGNKSINYQGVLIKKITLIDDNIVELV